VVEWPFRTDLKRVTNSLYSRVALQDSAATIMSVCMARTSRAIFSSDLTHWVAAEAPIPALTEIAQTATAASHLDFIEPPNHAIRIEAKRG
jgi:hypothetical protein